MSASLNFAEHCLDLLSELPALHMRRFFGGYALLSNGVQFAMIMDTLYFRVDDITRGSYESLGCRPFSYSARGRRVSVKKYMSVPPDALDNTERLEAIARQALQLA